MKKKYFVFLSVIGLLLALVWIVVFFELILPLELNRSLLISTASFFLFTYSLQILRLIKFRTGLGNPHSIFVVFFLLGLFIHLFCAAMTKNLLLLIPLFQPWEAQLSAVLILLAVIFNAKGVHTGLKGPKVKEVLINVPSKFKSLNGTRVVQISDLHVGPIIQKKYIQPVIHQVTALNPDILVFTGDIGDGNASLYGDELSGFDSIKTTYGKYYVTGNHEHMWGAGEWIESVEKAGIQPLINKGLQLNSNLFLGGVPDITAHNHDFEHSQPMVAVEGAEGFKILLAHQPKSCIEAEKAGFDLMLSGHTHNGQFFPFNFVVGFFNPYTRGLNQHGSMKVYVNAGSGFWGPPLRLGVESEITLLILKAEDENNQV